MKKDLFVYSLPESQIAQRPSATRGGARLLVSAGPNQPLQHTMVSQLAQHLPSNALLVVNDTKVVNARLHGTCGNRTFEIFLLELPHGEGGRSHVFGYASPGRHLRDGSILQMPGDVTLVVVEKPSDKNGGRFVFTSPTPPLDWNAYLQQHGQVPLPPYIKRLLAPDDRDKERYQTIFAQHLGSVAAPTAGLHFSDEILASLEQKGIKRVSVTLHVSSGTFLPVKADNVADHVMHTESCYVPRVSWDEIAKARAEGRPIVAVGTTAFRCVESFMTQQAKLDEWFDTRLFIYPKEGQMRYHPKIFSGIMTNFHQPGSTLFMLMCALVGFDHAHAAYKEAVDKGYMFLSYGDSSLWFWN
jgi:S-adenosylmethionine:tRNA ribosyltransferase-isomerase